MRTKWINTRLIVEYAGEAPDGIWKRDCDFQFYRPRHSWHPNWINHGIAMVLSVRRNLSE